MPSRPGTRGARWTRDASSTAPGTPMTTPSIARPSSPLASTRVVSERHDRAEHLGDVGAVDLDVLPGAHITAQVAERSAQEARSEVEAEHERGLGDRLEEQRAVAAAARVVVDLADERRVRAGTAARSRRSAWRCRRAARSPRARIGALAPDRLEHRALVEVLEERRDRRSRARRSPCRKELYLAGLPGRAACARRPPLTAA